MYIYLQCMYKVFYSTFHNFLPLSIIECTRTMDNGREFLNGLYVYKAHAQRQNKARSGIINKTTVLFVEPPSSVRWILFVGSLDPFLRFVGPLSSVRWTLFEVVETVIVPFNSARFDEVSGYFYRTGLWPGRDLKIK